MDVNDNAPKFEQSSYSCWLSEDAERGQFVTMITATDPDIVDHSRLVYDITGGNTQQMFDIDSKSGIHFCVFIYMYNSLIYFNWII